MKNRFFSLENFIFFHRRVLHPISKENTTWQEQKIYEDGWSACLDALEESANDTSIQDIFDDIFGNKE